MIRIWAMIPLHPQYWDMYRDGSKISWPPSSAAWYMPPNDFSPLHRGVEMTPFVRALCCDD